MSIFGDRIGQLWQEHRLKRSDFHMLGIVQNRAPIVENREAAPRSDKTDLVAGIEFDKPSAAA